MTDRSPTKPRRWIVHTLPLLVLLAAALAYYPSLLSDDLAPLNRDFGTIFLSKMQQQYDALRDGRLLLWDPILYGGTAFWPLPNTAPAYLPLLGGFLLRGSPLGGLNLTILGHLLLGALGVYAFILSFTGKRYAALVSALLFLAAPYSQHLAFILPLDFLALTWLPWTFFFLATALKSDRWIAWVVLAGISYSAVPWCGGYNIFLYGLILCGLLVCTGCASGSKRRRRARRGGVLLLFLTLFLVLSAGRLVPTTRWLPFTSRGNPLPYDFAVQGTFTLKEIFTHLANEGWITLFLCVTALFFGIRRRLPWAIPFSLALVLILVMTTGALHAFLYDFVPGFDRIREPRRVVTLLPVLVPILAGLGLSFWQTFLAFRGWKAWIVGLGFMALLGLDTVVFSNHERPRLYSLSRRMAANHLHQNLARRVGTEPRFRIHNFEDTRINLKRTDDLLHSVFKLEALEACLGNISVNRYDRDYFGVSDVDPARLWGILNCVYVYSGKPLEIPGLTFVDKFREDPLELKEDSDGPYLYQNTQALPRAYLSDCNVLFVPDERGWRALRKLLHQTKWPPFLITLVSGLPRDLIPPGTEWLTFFDVLITPKTLPPDESLLQLLNESGVLYVPIVEDADWARPLLAIKHDREARGLSIVPIQDPEPRWNGCQVNLPEECGGKCLVLAETFSIYPGWTAEVDGRPVPLFVANGAATAIPLPEGARRVSLSYVPPGFVSGMSITLAGLVLCAAYFLFLLRRRFT